MRARAGLWRRAAALPLSRLRKADVQACLDEVEELLLLADFGVDATERLLARIRKHPGSETISALRREIGSILEATPPPTLAQPATGPAVYLVAGVNGTGKTTSTAKLAHWFQSRGRSVLVAAADTFRAGAVQQLAVWAERAGADFLGGGEGGDPAAVAFDAVKAAVARKIDVAIIDTAGRLHTRADLMIELAKISRVVARQLAGAPHETLVVLDANTGQNALSQLGGFAQALPVTGIVLTRVDSSAKGGIVVALAEKYAIPVKLVGTGESLDDLAIFDPTAFLDGVFESSSIPKRENFTRLGRRA